MKTIIKELEKIKAEREKKYGSELLQDKLYIKSGIYIKLKRLESELRYDRINRDTILDLINYLIFWLEVK